MVAKGKKIDLLKVDSPVSPVTMLGYDDSTRLESNNTLIFDNICFRIQYYNQ